MNVKIHAEEDVVTVEVTTSEGTERLEYAQPGMLTGSDLRDVLALVGIQAEYTYDEGDGGEKDYNGSDQSCTVDCDCTHNCNCYPEEK